MDITIRDATLPDATAIADIYNQAVLHTTATFDIVPQSVQDREGWMIAHGGRHPVIVAEAEGRVVGWASLSRWSERPAYDRTAEVSVYVDESGQRRGIGSALTRTIVESGRSLGMHALMFGVCAENGGSVAMAEKIGFTQVGTLREVGEKFGRLLDVLVMELLLD
jgi:phosphinothricin acetyltransferase